MKIVYFNYIYDAVGPLIRTLELAKASADNGATVVVYFMRKGFSPSPFILARIEQYKSDNLSFRYAYPPIISLSNQGVNTAQQVNISPIPPKTSFIGLLKQALLSLRNVFKELDILETHKPDAIMARPDDAFSFCISSYISGIPLVLESDGPIEELQFFYNVNIKPIKFLDTLRAKSADAVICISEVCKDLWISKNIDAKRLFVIPNGANPDEFSPQSLDKHSTLKSQLNISATKIIGYSGNQRVWHGLGNLFQSALPYLQADKTIKLLIIGCGKSISLLDEFKIPVDIAAEQIIFTGRLNYHDMAKYIDLADVMVMPYNILPLFYFSPMRMFEAMSVGKLLICSKQGQMADILDERSAVLFFDPNIDGDLTRCLGNVLTNDELIKSGHRNREYLISEHSWHQRGYDINKAIEFAITNK